MAKGFQFREISKFPEIGIGESYNTSTQLSLPLTNGDLDDSVHSVITYLGKSAHPDFERYHVEHETLRPYRVRFQNKRRDNVIVVDEFDLYVPKNFTYVWADTNDRNCNELLRRIMTTEMDRNNDFSFLEHEVDLIKMEKDIQHDITGGHFNKLNIADVRAASIFGEGVGGSDDWRRYEDSGFLSAVVYQVPFFGTLQRVMVTKNGGIVIYSNFTEHDALLLIEQVNDEVRKFVENPKKSSDQD
jgi:hypothetical protein